MTLISGRIQCAAFANCACFHRRSVILMELKERLQLIKDRYREVILKRRQELERELEMLYGWDDEPDVLDDASLARELRRQREEQEE